MEVEMEIVFCFLRFPGGLYQSRDVTPHDVEHTGGQCLIGIVAFDSAAQEIGTDSQPFLTLIALSGGNPQVVHEEVLFRSDVLETVDVDFTVHVVDGATGEVGFYLYGQFRVLVFGREVQGVGAEMVDSGTEVEGGCLAGSIDRAAQLYGAVFVVERYVTVEAALLIFSVQSDVFVGIVTVVYGCHQPFHGNGGVSLGVMVAFDVHVEGDFSKLVVVQHPAQFESGCLYRTRISEIALVFVGTEFDVCLDGAYIRADFAIGHQVREVSGNLSTERYRAQILQYRRNSFVIFTQVAYKECNAVRVGI